MKSERPAYSYMLVAWRIMPLLMSCYVAAQITRFNIGFARGTLASEFAISDATFGLIASSFYVGYLVAQWPASLLLGRFGLRRMLLCSILGWGLIGITLPFVRGASDLMALRFLLGVAQAGFFPGMMLYLAGWFPPRMRGRVNNGLTTAIPIGAVAGGLLAGAIMGHMGGVGSLANWQWLFLLEGLGTVAIGIVVFTMLPATLERAGGLKKDDSVTLRTEVVESTNTSVENLGLMTRDPALWRLGLCYFGYFCALNALILWGPSVIQSVGAAQPAAVGWLSGLTSLVALIGMLSVGIHFDRSRGRIGHVLICGLTAAACFLLLPLARDDVVLTAGLLILAGAGLYPILGLFWTIPPAALRGGASPRSYAIINSFGVCGGIVSPTVVGGMKQLTDSLFSGLAVVAALLVMSMALLPRSLGPDPKG